MTEQPRVSVIMSVLNGEAFLRQAIDSVLGQTFRDFEFIVIDNASSDRTAAILDGYHDDRIVRLCNGEVCSLSPCHSSNAKSVTDRVACFNNILLTTAPS